jgi:hypothetical protein
MVTGEGKLQVTGWTALAGLAVMAQARVMAPMNPLDGVAVVVVVLPVESPAVTVMLLVFVRENVGVGACVTVTVAEPAALL